VVHWMEATREAAGKPRRGHRRDEWPLTRDGDDEPEKGNSVDHASAWFMMVFAALSRLPPS
jgi:hypothetical protein